MAAKSKKRLSKTENKLLKLENLELKDVVCYICQSILVEPVILPCFHYFCHHCFKGSIENNALCCPLCRLRIGSWLRSATKQKNLVNEELWKFIKTKFAHEIYKKTKGEDIDLPAEKPHLRLSAPGEIREEYEAELSRLRKERLQLEQKHIEKTEILIKKIQEEEEEAHRKYLEALKKDEIVAQQIMQNELLIRAPPSNTPQRSSFSRSTKSRLKETKIDSFLSKTTNAPSTDKHSNLLNDDNNRTESSTLQHNIPKVINGASPEMVPSYSNLIRSIIEKKNKVVPGLWNKENGDMAKGNDECKINGKMSLETEDNKSKVKTKNGLPSLVVSLPLPYASILQQKANISENRKETGSVDSMRQELCYFKPIDEVTPTRNTNKGVPLRVPAVRALDTVVAPNNAAPAPIRAQYLESLCRLRHLSLSRKLTSAFVIALDLLRFNKKEERSVKCGIRDSLKGNKLNSASPCAVPAASNRRQVNRNKQIAPIDHHPLVNNEINLRRTRSMGSLTKEENETTPKKVKIDKQRKAVSDRKPYLRSDSKKSSKKGIESPVLYSGSINNNKVKLAVKNLSSPLKNCDVKHIIYHEQLRIEKIIEQEKKDFELARQIEAEWNERRPRRAAVKRQVSIHYSVKPAKKLKI